MSNYDDAVRVLFEFEAGRAHGKTVAYFLRKMLDGHDVLSADLRRYQEALGALNNTPSVVAIIAERDTAIHEANSRDAMLRSAEECLALYRSGRIGSEEFALAHERIVVEEIAKWLDEDFEAPQLAAFRDGTALPVLAAAIEAIRSGAWKPVPGTGEKK